MLVQVTTSDHKSRWNSQKILTPPNPRALGVETAWNEIDFLQNVKKFRESSWLPPCCTVSSSERNLHNLDRMSVRAIVADRLDVYITAGTFCSHASIVFKVNDNSSCTQWGVLSIIVLFVSEDHSCNAMIGSVPF